MQVSPGSLSIIHDSVIREMLIKLTDVSKTSVEFIDLEHKQLVDGINILWQFIEKKSCPENDGALITEKLQEIITHLRAHFAREENLMKESGFPATEQHMNEHQVFLNKAEKACADYLETRDLKRLKKFVSKSMKKDFLDHIMVADSIATDCYIPMKEI